MTNEYITQIDAKTLVATTADGIKEDISKMYTTRDYVNTLSAEFNRTAEGLTAQISEVNEALDGANEVYTIQGTPTLQNYPAYNWTSGPVVGDKLTQGLRFTYSDTSYKKHNRALVYDEVAGKTYRFIKSGDTWGFSDVGDTEFSWVNKKLAEYKATADGLSADLSKFETKVNSDYITKIDAQASIKLSADELKEDFSKTISNYSTTTQMNLAISESAEGIMTNVSKTYATKGVVSRLETSIKATAEGLETKVSKDKLVTEINASAEKVLISSSKLDLKGLVTISALQESGQTVINADNITTGTIKGRRLEACAMDGGAIAIGANNIVMNEAGLWVIGECSADKPAYQVNNRGEIMQYWTDGIRRFYSNGLGVSGTWVTHFDEYTASSDWYKICIAANNTSDARYKNTIKSLDDEEHMEELFNSLKPSAFYYNKGTEYVETQRHLGFIAQDIEKAITEAGIEADMALFDHINEDKLGVNKQELIALCVWQIQKLKARVKELETNIGGAT